MTMRTKFLALFSEHLRKQQRLQQLHVLCMFFYPCIQHNQLLSLFKIPAISLAPFLKAIPRFCALGFTQFQEILNICFPYIELLLAFEDLIQLNFTITCCNSTHWSFMLEIYGSMLFPYHYFILFWSNFLCRNDSTGIPHILEHSVLCGSRKYPLKEPFVELLKGSLHTFLNAFTYPDRTCYPVASTNTKVKRFYQVPLKMCVWIQFPLVPLSKLIHDSLSLIQDFYNLVDVYLDAVFFPKCVEDYQTFQQEGWHYELNDPSEDITYKGSFY